MTGYPNLACPSCPTDCTTNTALPIVQSDPCAQTWDIRNSEGRYVILSPWDGATFTAPIDDADMETLGNWTTLIDNDGVIGTEARQLTIVGFLQEPEDTNIEWRGSTILTDRKYKYEFSTIDVNPSNYTFARQVSQCPVTCWISWSTAGGSLFGWALAKVSSTLSLDQGADSLETLTFVAEWQANCLPPRYDSPFA